MAKKLKSYRLEEDLLARVGVYAKSRGASETALVEAALEWFMAEAKGGVPDLPAEKPVYKPKAKPAPQESYSQIMGGRQSRLAKEMGWSS